MRQKKSLVIAASFALGLATLGCDQTDSGGADTDTNGQRILSGGDGVGTGASTERGLPGGNPDANVNRAAVESENTGGPGSTGTGGNAQTGSVGAASNSGAAGAANSDGNASSGRAAGSYGSGDNASNATPGGAGK